MVLINEAYEVLSDVNQRTWYDNHRTQILSGSSEKSESDSLEASFGGLNVKKY
jgi:curved DNA-binding protein CbpA